jgi:hypothetical protein
MNVLDFLVPALFHIYTDDVIGIRDEDSRNPTCKDPRFPEEQ